MKFGTINLLVITAIAAVVLSQFHDDPVFCGWMAWFAAPLIFTAISSLFTRSQPGDRRFGVYVGLIALPLISPLLGMTSMALIAIPVWLPQLIIVEHFHKTAGDNNGFGTRK